MRTISIQPKLSKTLHTLILEQRIKAKDNPNKLIFANESSTPPTSNGVNKMLHKLMTKADIKKDRFTFHGLRHTHISYLLLHGVSIYYISQRVYSHILARLKKDEEKKTLDALSHL